MVSRKARPMKVLLLRATVCQTDAESAPLLAMRRLLLLSRPFKFEFCRPQQGCLLCECLDSFSKSWHFVRGCISCQGRTSERSPGNAALPFDHVAAALPGRAE